MGLKQLAFIITTVFLLSAGQILFKVAAAKIDFVEAGVVSSLLFNYSLWIALLVYGIATVCWLIVLNTIPLRVAYPFVALGFFIVPILSSIFLNEPLTTYSLLGAAIITVGVYISSLS